MSTKVSRGFADMEPERLREITSLGGRTAHKCGTAHEFTTDEARSAGRKGGVAISADREHMAKIGRVGGRRRWQKKFASGSETQS